ncbi:MAG: hypothetical protein GWP18_04755 [Proteobacteria bacterium]|nr:hypothetical protein [Pseudomonadota bacterium]
MRRVLSLGLGALLVATACQTADTSTGETPSSDDGVVLPAGFDLQGHRGARGLKPENTLPSFEAALDLGVGTLELDLHFSSDDEVVVWHDPVVDPSKCRVAQGAPADVPDPDDPSTPSSALEIRSLTVMQLSWYRCDRNPDVTRFPRQDGSPTSVAGASYGIAPLVALIAFVEVYASDQSKTAGQRANASEVVFNVETKRDAGDPGAIGDGFNGVDVGPFEARLLEIIKAAGIGDRTTIQSFDPRSLVAIRAVEPGIPLAFLTVGGLVDIGAYAAAGGTIWSPNSMQVTENRVIQAHEAGLAVVPWTVNTIEEADRVISLGVDGLITDVPDLFVIGS